MNQRATEYDLNNQQFEQLMDKYVMTIVDSMSHEDFRQFVLILTMMTSLIIHYLNYLKR